jgi:3-oxoacyl-[acyl-carrier-protein] synthase-3
MYSKIIGTGSYLPAKVLTNFDLEKLVDTSHEWIKTRTGIVERHVAAEGELTSDLALHASRKAIEMAGVKADEIDLIIVATTTPDQIFPSTACLLQDKLGIRQGAAFDVQAVCSGFVYALNTADLYIRSGQARTALVVGAEVLTRLLDWTDRITCVLFGDGAGAVVLQASETPGILGAKLHADGRYRELLKADARISQGKVEGMPFMFMDGQGVFKFAVKALSEVVEELLADLDMQDSDISWLIPHQANIRIIEATAKKLKLDMSRVVLTVAQHGNTSAGENLLLEAIGGGFAWGAVMVRW